MNKKIEEKKKKDTTKTVVKAETTDNKQSQFKKRNISKYKKIS